jgi:hypothetical protein
MTPAAWRLLMLPIVVIAFLLVGTPEFPAALHCAVTKTFRAAAQRIAPAGKQAPWRVTTLGSPESLCS